MNYEMRLINGIERRVIQTPIGVRYDDLVNRDYKENTVSETFKRTDGSQYMLIRGFTERELAERRAHWTEAWGYYSAR